MESKATSNSIREFLEDERIPYNAWEEFFEVDLYDDIYLFERTSLRTWIMSTPGTWKRFNGSQSVIEFIAAKL